MKNTFVSLLFLSALFMYGCSGDDTTGANNAGQPATEAQVAVSQAETMEEIWASSLEPAEKAKRVQELLARSGN
jgi:PBP1b-binding outer membrane lipoprotein LpoB